MTHTITSSSELMTNDLRAEVLGPQTDVDALQTPDGRTVLFGVGTDGALNAVVEQHGTHTAGFTVTDVSAAQRGAPGSRVSVFDAGQNSDGTFGLAMAVTGGAADTLYVSLGNAGTDLGWIGSPQWTAVPADADGLDPATLRIVGIRVCEPSGSAQHLVVDVLRDPGGVAQDVSRYVVDPTVDPAATGPRWTHRDVPVDLAVAGYSTVVGRTSGASVDGLYTAGSAAGRPQLVYVPIRGPRQHGAIPVTRLQMPSGAVPSALATMRNPDLSTDLFVVSGSTLYHFASTEQHTDAEPVPVLDLDVITGTSELVAMRHDGVVTVWGRNGSDQVWSADCRQDTLATGPWSRPTPLLSDVEQMTAFCNVADGGNTIIAAGGGELRRMTRSGPNGTWAAERFLLPARPPSRSMRVTSYTTTIHVSGDDGMPVPEASIAVSAGRRAAVYVDGLYYVVGATPVHLTADHTGTVTIVEAVEALAATTFTVVTEAGASVPLDPAADTIARLTALDTAGAVRGATIHDDTGAAVRPLVPSDVDETTVATLAAGMAQLGRCATSLKAPSSRPLVNLAAATPVELAGAGAVLDGLGDAVLVGIGDLVQTVTSRGEEALQLVEVVADIAWTLVVHIGDLVLAAVIDTAEAVAGAAEVLWQLAKAGYEDLKAFLEVLFHWADISRTKQVLHTLLMLFVRGQVDELSSLRSEIDGQFATLEKLVEPLTGTDWSSIGEVAGKPAAGSAVNPHQGQTASSRYLHQHFVQNADGLTLTGAPPQSDPVDDLIQKLLDAVVQEGEILSDAVASLRQLAKESPDLTVEQTLIRLMAIIAEGVLGSANVVTDVVLDILIAVASEAVGLLDADITVPVLSDVLEDLGVPKFSLLDVVCWVAACSYTIVYKLAHDGTAPFPDDASTAALISAGSLEELRQVFAGQQPVTAIGPADGVVDAVLDGLPPIPRLTGEVGSVVFDLGHAVGGLTTLVNAVVASIEANQEKGTPASPVSRAATISAIVAGASAGVADVLAGRLPVTDPTVNWVSRATTAARILFKVVFAASGKIQERLVKSGILKDMSGYDSRAVGAVVDVVLVLPALFCTSYHLAELSKQPASVPRSEAIIDETAAIVSYLTRVLYCVAVNDPDPETRGITVGIMAGTTVVNAGLQMAVAAVEDRHPVHTA